MSYEQKQLIEFAIQDLVAEIVRAENISPESAMDLLYHSDFFSQLTRSATGLYREGAEYLYHCFKNTMVDC